MYPTRGVFPACCARPATGHVAAPPSSEMNSRRFIIRSPRRRGRQRERDRKAERLGGLEVDVQLDFGGLLDRQIGGVVALENPAGIESGDSMRVPDAWSLPHQTSPPPELPPLVSPH